MEVDRIGKALNRIAAAVDRIEACHAHPVAAAEHRYQALRVETGAALRDLDSLIAGLER